MKASIAELARVPGIGNMRAEKIRKILDTSVSTEVNAYTQKKLIMENSDGGEEEEEKDTTTTTTTTTNTTTNDSS